MFGKVGLKSFFKCFTFRPLMIDFYAIKDHISYIGGFFIGKDEFIKAIQIGCKKSKKRQNARNGNVSIVSFSAFVHLKKFRVKNSGVDNPWSINFAGCESMQWVVANAE
jgi:hypothetical protein